MPRADRGVWDAVLVVFQGLVKTEPFWNALCFGLPEENVETHTTTKRVLVVEDDCILRTSLKRVLEHAGFDVVAVAEFGRALDLIEAELFDALITDLDLPDGTGLDLLVSVRHLRPRMRSILITGYGCSAIRKQADELDHVVYFEKPFDPAELLAALS